jgi:hypothetical protein
MRAPFATFYSKQVAHIVTMTSAHWLETLAPVDRCEMTRRGACVAAALLLACCFAATPAAAAPNKDDVVRLVVAYCPTDFTGEGALVDVDPFTGAWTVSAHFKFPSDILGCVADYDPTYTFDAVNPNTIWFDFTSQAGYFVGIDMVHGNHTTVSSGSLFFTGFLDFAQFPHTRTLRGITGTVTENGYCSDACIGMGVQDLANANYTALSTLPFKETADDARFIDREQRIMYFQAAYDLDNVGCAPLAEEQCMLAVNLDTGALLNATYSAHQFQVYKYGRGITDQGAVNAFMLGFDHYCGDSANNSATTFGLVNVRTGQATPFACIPSTTVIDTDQWVGGYSKSERVFATASGNGEGDPPQFISFNVSTGAVLTNTNLTGLPTALHADMKLIFIWGVEFAW